MRVITKKIKAYKFDELPEAVQEKVINNNRYINVSEGWWDDVLDSHIISWKGNGITATPSKICFSLDRDQYLYFPHNYLWIENIKLFVEAIKGVVPKNVLESIKKNDVVVSFDVRHYGGGSGKQIAKYEVYNNTFLPEVSEELTSWINKLFTNLWNELKNSYYMDVSDEAVKETLCINEYEYDSEGDIL